MRKDARRSTLETRAARTRHQGVQCAHTCAFLCVPVSAFLGGES